MKNVKIVGIGVISALGNSVQEVWDNLKQKKPTLLAENKLSYTSALPAAKRRRINRYSDMAVFSAFSAKQDFHVPEDVSPGRIGTIYTTGYGPMVSNLDFARKVNMGDPDLCSPTVFSGTVSNVGVGHICMNLNCKGVSTIIMGSNNLGYTHMLLSKEAADYIFTGAVEEYDEELYRCFRSSKVSKEVAFCESTVSFLLTRESKISYCTLIDFFECSLGTYPVFNKVNEEYACNNMINVLKQASERKKVDLVISSENGSFFDKVERNAINTVFPNITVISNVKQLFGETLGVAFNINVLVAALILKNGEIPAALHCENTFPEKFGCILVTGYDVSGNYTAYIIEKS